MAQWDGSPISWGGEPVSWGEGAPETPELIAQDIVTGAPEISQPLIAAELTAQDIVTGPPEISQADIPLPPVPYDAVIYTRIRVGAAVVDL